MRKGEHRFRARDAPCGGAGNAGGRRDVVFSRGERLHRDLPVSRFRLVSEAGAAEEQCTVL